MGSTREPPLCPVLTVGLNKAAPPGRTAWKWLSGAVVAVNIGSV